MRQQFPLAIPLAHCSTILQPLSHTRVRHKNSLRYQNTAPPGKRRFCTPVAAHTLLGPTFSSPAPNSQFSGPTGHRSLQLRWEGKGLKRGAEGVKQATVQQSPSALSKYTRKHHTHAHTHDKWPTLVSFPPSKEARVYRKQKKKGEKKKKKETAELLTPLPSLCNVGSKHQVSGWAIEDNSRSPPQFFARCSRRRSHDSVAHHHFCSSYVAQCWVFEGCTEVTPRNTCGVNRTVSSR